MRVKDAHGRKVMQLDPVAMYFLCQSDVIPSEPLRNIAAELDPAELEKRPRAALFAPFWVVLWYAAWFLYFRLFSTWRGWDPVLIAFGVSYFLFPFVWVYNGFRKARHVRWERVRRVMCEHLRCPHCGYDIRGLPVAPEDGATICPECGSAWKLEDA